MHLAHLPIHRIRGRTRSYKGEFINRILSDSDTAKQVKLEKSMESTAQLHPYYVLKLFQEVEQHLSHLPNINRISTCYSEEITNGLPSPQKLYVFNGDLVDRGPHSIEILIIIFVFLLIYPKEDHAHRLLAVIKNVFSSIPLATVIDRKVLIILSVLAPKRRKTLDYTASQGGPLIRSGSTINVPQGGQQTNSKSAGKSPGTQKNVQPSPSLESEDSHDSASYEDDDIEQVIDILWSDPDPKPGCTENEERGGGCYFGPDVTDTFLQKHRLQFIIRSHECKPEGYEVDHNR
ncbi:hypothetical protein E2320_007416, partial [Naja naja]